jgi:hypothetical protein
VTIGSVDVRRIDLDLLFRLGLATAVAMLILPAVVDVDLWGHVMFGRDIVHSRAIPASDHYAFTSDLAWVDHEWLTEVAMFAAYAAHPGAGLVALRVLLIAALLWVVWVDLRRDGLSTRAALTLVTLLALLTYPRTQHVRPQLFSLVAFAILLTLLKAADRQQRTALVGLPVVVALWANLHGGFVVALVPLALWAGRALFDPTRTTRERATTFGLCASAALASAVNPYGMELWRFLARTVGPERADITEWLPVISAGGAVFIFWGVTAALAVLALRRHTPRPPIERILLVVGLAVASFRVSRLDAFFAIATFLSLSPGLAALLARERVARDRPVRTIRPAPAVLLLIAVAAAFLITRGGPSPLTCVDMASADWLPERAASQFVAEKALRGRMVVYFDWGEYVLWHFAPEIKVSIDGRRETIYSDRHISSHLELYGGTARGLEYLRELDAHYVWVPKSLPVVGKLPALGWYELYDGPRSVIFARAAETSRRAIAWRSSANRCFPGP